jgi:ribonuclease-3
VSEDLPSTLADLPRWPAEDGGEDDEQAAAVDAMDRLQDRLGYRFADAALLRVALTAGSWTNENQSAGWPSNACLEFFGDAVLGLAAADALWRRFPEADEGTLTRLRAAVVSKRSLAPAARRLELGDCLFVGRGDEQRGGRSRDGTLADALEAVLGAIYLDARRAERDPAAMTRNTFDRVFGVQVEALQLDDGVDNKSRLQHLVQRAYRRTPRYIQVGEPPPPTAPHWLVRVEVVDEAGTRRVLGEGEGRSVKIAEQRAAKAALEAMEADS